MDERCCSPSLPTYARRNGALIAFAAALGLCTVPVRVAVASVITVNTTADVVADDGSCSLREAITSVNLQTASGNMVGECAAGDGANDTVVLAAGAYVLAIGGADEDNNASGDLDVRSAVTIAGAAAGITTIDANGIDRVIDIPVAVTVALRDLSLVNGHAPDGTVGAGEAGGAIRSAGGTSLALARVELANNRSGNGASSGSFSGFSGGSGGAIYAGGSLALAGSSLHDNHTGAGGDVSPSPGAIPGSGGSGGAIAAFGDTGIETTTFVRNWTGDGGNGAPFQSSGSGGAVYIQLAPLAILQSAFDSNHTGSTGTGGNGGGGALWVDQNDVDIEQSGITRNVAGFGGGIHVSFGTLTLRNVSLSDNYSGSQGGGLSMSAGSAQLDFVTLSANTAVQEGGGLYLAGANNSGALAFRNSILAGNSAPSQPDCDAVLATLTSQGYNVVGSGCPTDGPGDVASSDPQLGPLADNGGISLSRIPAPGSPATDGGNCLASNTSVDARGHLRFVDVPRAPDAFDACDIGAIELDDDIFWDAFDR